MNVVLMWSFKPDSNAVKEKHVFYSNSVPEKEQAIVVKLKGCWVTGPRWCWQWSFHRAEVLSKNGQAFRTVDNS